MADRVRPQKLPFANSTCTSPAARQVQGALWFELQLRERRAPGNTPHLAVPRRACGHMAATHSRPLGRGVASTRPTLKQAAAGNGRQSTHAKQTAGRPGQLAYDLLVYIAGLSPLPIRALGVLTLASKLSRQQRNSGPQEAGLQVVCGPCTQARCVRYRPRLAPMAAAPWRCWRAPP